MLPTAFQMARNRFPTILNALSSLSCGALIASCIACAPTTQTAASGIKTERPVSETEQAQTSENAPTTLKETLPSKEEALNSSDAAQAETVVDLPPLERHLDKVKDEKLGRYWKFSSNRSPKAFILYLHGMCGALESAEIWAEALSEDYLTVMPIAEEPCSGRAGSKWTQSSEKLATRLALFIETFSQEEGSEHHLPIVLFGYSQGGARVIQLAQDRQLHPAIRATISGSPPKVALDFKPDRPFALLWGEKEQAEPYNNYLKQKLDAKIPVISAVLPGVTHGQFGQQSPVVIQSLIEELLKTPAQSDEIN